MTTRRSSRMRQALGIVRRLRWPALAAVVAGAAIAVAGCGSGSSATGSTAGRPAGFVPAGAPLYLEASADMNSAQWRQVRTLGQKFPGWGELTARITKSLKDDGLDYTTDIAPYVGSRAAFAVTRVPSISGRAAGGILSGRAASAQGAARAAAEQGGFLAVVDLADGADQAVQGKLAKAANGAPGTH